MDLYNFTDFSPQSVEIVQLFSLVFIHDFHHIDHHLIVIVIIEGRLSSCVSDLSDL